MSVTKFFLERIQRMTSDFSGSSKSGSQRLKPSLFRLSGLPILFAVGCLFSPLFAEDERKISKLAQIPDWSQLELYQETITRVEFERELLTNYCENETSAEKFIEILDDRARIIKDFKRPDEVFELRFADETHPAVPRYWRSADELPPYSDPERPLEGMRIAIDPGHIGGLWAKMEERWFKIEPKADPLPEVTEEEGEADSSEEAEIEIEEVDDTFPVKEGEIVMRVGELLEENLTKLGARVALVRRENRPINPKRPEDYVELARTWGNHPPDADPATNKSLRKYSEILFYRTDEIRYRAARINDQFKPDLTLCLHVNAEGWGDPSDPDFVDKNHFHILINGCYSAGEIAYDDQRFEMLCRLLQRTHPEELAVSQTVANVMANVIELPPYRYLRSNAKLVSPNPFVWSRNLLATRVYESPIVFFEPHVMNHKLTYDRVQAGEYAGKRYIHGKERINIYQEYADAASEGVATYYRQHRKQKPHG